MSADRARDFCKEGAQLSDGHFKLIVGSAIAPEVARERGYRTITTKTELERYGFGKSQRITPTLLIPLYSAIGKHAGYQHRPDKPRLAGQRAVKYETPAKSRMIIDVHPVLSQKRIKQNDAPYFDQTELPALIADPADPLFITEGVRKADAGVSIHLCCVALLGVWNWRGTNQAGGKTALADWELIALEGRLVYIMFDSDVMVKRMVAAALRRLKAFLERRGATVKLIYLPPGVHDEKVGLDDFVAQQKAAGRSNSEIRNALLALATDELRKPVTQPEQDNEEPGRDSAGRPTIFVNGGQLRDRTKQAIKAMEQRKDPPVLFSRGIMVRLKEETYELEELDAKALLAELAEASDWMKHTRWGDMAADPSSNVVSAILGTRRLPFPRIESVARAPFFTRDGKLVVQPGYHPYAGVYFAPDATLAPQLAGHSYPEEPTPEDVAWACAMLDDLFYDFPFVDDASKAHAKALTLLPFVRLMIDGPTPNHAVGAPARGEGTGKGLLIQTACVPGLGEVEASPETGDKEEIRKVLLAAMLDNAPIVWFDNVKGEVNSGALAAILTARNWIDRILGKSKRFRGRVLTTWCIAGNGLRFSREIRRRTVMIRLAANTPRAWLRAGFKHELPAWAHANRATLIRARIILVHNWIARGRPTGERVLGSYENWAHTIGGILQAAGIEGFLENYDERSEETDGDAQRWAPFVEDWWNAHKDNPVTAKALLPLAGDIVPTDGKSERSRATRLGLLLSQRVDACFEVDGYQAGYLKIVRADVEREGKRTDAGYKLMGAPKNGVNVRDVREISKNAGNPAKTKENFSPNIEPKVRSDYSNVREAQVFANKGESQLLPNPRTLKGVFPHAEIETPDAERFDVSNDEDSYRERFD